MVSRLFRTGKERNKARMETGEAPVLIPTRRSARRGSERSSQNGSELKEGAAIAKTASVGGGESYRDVIPL